MVYDSCQEIEFLIDKNEALKEYPLAVFPDKTEKVDLDTNNPFLPTDPDTNDSSDPFKGEEPTTPTEPETPTEPTTPVEPPVDNGGETPTDTVDGENIEEMLDCVVGECRQPIYYE